MKLLFVALAVLSATAYAIPDPPIWPEAFEADQTIRTLFKERPAATYYDYSVPAQRTEMLGWCMPLFAGQLAKKWSCSFLIKPAGIYHIAEDSKVESNRCCMFSPGLAPSPPDWVKNMDFMGEEVEEGILSNHWLAEGHHYFSAVEDDTPVKFAALTFMGKTESIYHNYKEGSANPPLGWDLPDFGVDCDRECTRRGPDGEFEVPEDAERNPELMAVLMAEYNRRFA